MTIEVRRMLQQATASRSADEMLKAGAAALQSGFHAEAVVPIKNFLRRQPNNASLWHLLGVLYRHVDEIALAQAAFVKATELAPEDGAIAHGHACVAFEAGLPAAHLFERAIRLSPPDKAMLLRHAAAKIAEGMGDAAIESLEEELRRNPEWVQGHAAVARVRWTRGEHEHFTDSFQRALLARPGDMSLWSAYIELLLQSQLYARAVTAIEKARLAARSPQAFYAAEALARSETGELEAAEALFRQLAPLNDVGSIVAYLRFLFRAARIKEAAAIAEKAAPHDPSNRIWPYLSVAWRVLADPRWAWLEGDPRFIGVYDISERLPPLDVLAAQLREFHQASHPPLDQSLRGGSQTEGHLFSKINPEMRRLRLAVVEAVKEHIAQIPSPAPGHPLLLQKRSPIAFSGSWSVRLSGGGRHVEHVHPAGWLSSALYIALPSEHERGPRDAGCLTLGQVRDFGIDLPPIRLVEPKLGRLVLFPSTMWHGTKPFKAGERLTVAFDVKRPS